MRDRKEEKKNPKCAANPIYNYFKGKKRDEQEATYFGTEHDRKGNNIIRLWFTNPCGLGVDAQGIKSHDSFHFLKKESCSDVIR